MTALRTELGGKVSEGFAALNGAGSARSLAAAYVSEGEPDKATRHKQRAHFWLQWSERSRKPRLP